jgi:hypothetical protein
VFILSPPFTDVGEVWISSDHPTPHLVSGLLGNPLSHSERNQRASRENVKKKRELRDRERGAILAELDESGVGFTPTLLHRV